MRNRSRPYDLDNVQRSTPSIRTRRLYEHECIVFLTTFSSYRGASFKELVQDIDVVLNYECANSLEPLRGNSETFI